MSVPGTCLLVSTSLQTMYDVLVDTVRQKHKYINTLKKVQPDRLLATHSLL